MKQTTSIRLEASNHCQLKCTACPTASGEIRPVLGASHLQLNDFARLLDQDRWIKDIELSNYGEIFLNPELGQIIEYAFVNHVGLHADNGVNFNFANDSVLRRMVLYEFKSIRVSLDGATPATYAKYRIGGDLHNVLGNIIKLNDYKQRYNSQYPELTWQFILFKHNVNEFAKARQMAADLGMKFQYKLNWDPELAPKHEQLVQIALGDEVGSREEYRKQHHEAYLSNLCEQLWFDPVINSDGKNLGCCRNFWSDFGGNAFTDTVRGILYNEKMVYAREMLRGKAVAKPGIPCTDCELYLSRIEDGNWLTLPEPIIEP